MIRFGIFGELLWMAGPSGFLYRLDLSKMNFLGEKRNLMKLVTPTDCDPQKTVVDRTTMRFTFAPNLVTILFDDNRPMNVKEPGLRYFKFEGAQPTMGRGDLELVQLLDGQSYPPEFDVKYQNIICNHLSRRVICIGMYRRVAKKRSKGEPTTKTLIIGCFWWLKGPNTMQLMGKTSMLLDSIEFATEPNHSKVEDTGHQFIQFSMRSNKIICLANAETNKQIVRVLVLHHGRFLMAGSSNTRVPGVYTFPVHESVYFFAHKPKNKALLVGYSATQVGDTDRVAIRSRDYILAY